MNREQKTEFVEQVRERFSSAPLVILSDWKGSTVAEMDAIRRACEPAGVHFQVVKNTLCRRAVAGTDMEGLSEHFRGNIGVFFAGDDPIAAAKLYRDQKKANDKLICRAGFFEGDILDEKGVLRDAEVNVAVLDSVADTYTVYGEPVLGSTNIGTYAIPRPDFRLLDALALARGVPGRTRKLWVYRTSSTLTQDLMNAQLGVLSPEDLEGGKSADAKQLVDTLIQQTNPDANDDTFQFSQDSGVAAQVSLVYDGPDGDGVELEATSTPLCLSFVEADQAFDAARLRDAATSGDVGAYEPPKAYCCAARQQTKVECTFDDDDGAARAEAFDQLRADVEHAERTAHLSQLEPSRLKGKMCHAQRMLRVHRVIVSSHAAFIVQTVARRLTDRRDDADDCAHGLRAEVQTSRFVVRYEVAHATDGSKNNRRTSTLLLVQPDQLVRDRRRRQHAQVREEELDEVGGRVVHVFIGQIPLTQREGPRELVRLRRDVERPPHGSSTTGHGQRPHFIDDAAILGHRTSDEDLAHAVSLVERHDCVTATRDRARATCRAAKPRARRHFPHQRTHVSASSLRTEK